MESGMDFFMRLFPCLWLRHFLSFRDVGHRQGGLSQAQVARPKEGFRKQYTPVLNEF
jgi:hypothetical protein